MLCLEDEVKKGNNCPISNVSKVKVPHINQRARRTSGLGERSSRGGGEREGRSPISRRPPKTPVRRQAVDSLGLALAGVGCVAGVRVASATHTHTLFPGLRSHSVFCAWPRSSFERRRRGRSHSAESCEAQRTGYYDSLDIFIRSGILWCLVILRVTAVA
ncbi:hypothetical protein E2C01_050167 [Portunus trituberculatus]|uniref:Uncharacterized protein n=1 Tax=Portunus trituberculatus TaxID=210409 RepID=A0A5B7GI66_PORTR|nr:hypothetical protein [Portunus trituberculatus]